MQDKQIAMIIFLIVVIMLALVVSVKLYNFFRNFDNQLQLDQHGDSFRDMIMILEKTIPLSQLQYERIKISFEEIQYQIDEQTFEGYRFQKDNKGNWNFCKYKQEQNQITLFKNKSNNILRTQGLNEQFEFFSNIDVVINENYFYNQPITQQKINDGDISVLDIYILHLNQDNLTAFLCNNSFKKIEALFLPSFILDDWKIQPTTIKQRFQEFLFYYEPIQYRVDILYRRLIFIWKSQKENHIILVEINFDEIFIKIHNTSKESQNHNYQELCNQLNFLQTSQQLFTSLCPFCKGKKQKSQTYDVCFLVQNHISINNENLFEKSQDLQKYIQDKLLIL